MVRRRETNRKSSPQSFLSLPPSLPPSLLPYLMQHRTIPPGHRGPPRDGLRRGITCFHPSCLVKTLEVRDKQAPMPRISDQAVAARRLRIGPAIAVGEGKEVQAQGQAFEQDGWKEGEGGAEGGRANEWWKSKWRR